MEKIILDSASDGLSYECFGPYGSRILTDSKVEAHLWRSLGPPLFTSGAVSHSAGKAWGNAMLIMMKSIPLAQDPRIVIACIRACIWADVEGRPFCTLK
jgi:hypothetical protein